MTLREVVAKCFHPFESISLSMADKLYEREAAFRYEFDKSAN